jgi:hypothetical protein
MTTKSDRDVAKAHANNRRRSVHRPSQVSEDSWGPKKSSPLEYAEKSLKLAKRNYDFALRHGIGVSQRKNELSEAHHEYSVKQHEHSQGVVWDDSKYKVFPFSTI